MKLVTNAAISVDIQKLRVAVKKQGTEIHKLLANVKRLVESHNDHERRISELEPMREGYRDMVVCVENVSREMRSIRDTYSALKDDIASSVSANLREESITTRRELRTEIVRIGKLIEDHVKKETT